MVAQLNHGSPIALRIICQQLAQAVKTILGLRAASSNKTSI
jgi:hypothetical protein